MRRGGMINIGLMPSFFILLGQYLRIKFSLSIARLVAFVQAGSSRRYGVPADTLMTPHADLYGNGMVRDVVRGGRLEGERTGDVAWLLSSAGADRWIGEADLLVDLAHVLMLGRQGIVEPAHVRTLLGGLLVLRDGGLPESVYDPAYEDVHAGIEAHLTAMVGEEAGGRLHVGRSRNDEVATCLRLRLRDELLALAGEVCALRRVLVGTATAHVETVMPGFTHLQPAQPTTLAHHLLAYGAAFERDTARLLDCYARTNRSPLGSAAFASTGYRLDREWTAARLGFSGDPRELHGRGLGPGLRARGALGRSRPDGRSEPARGRARALVLAPGRVRRPRRRVLLDLLDHAPEEEPRHDGAGPGQGLHGRRRARRPRSGS